MTDFATLGIAVDSRPVESARQALDRIVRSSNEAERATQGFVRAVASGRGPAADFARAFAEADRTQNQMSQGAQRVIEQMSQEMVLLNATARQRRQLQAIMQAGVSVHTAEAHAIARLAGSLHDAEQKAGSFRNKFEAVGQSMVLTGSRLGGVVSVLSRMGPVGLAAGVGLGAAATGMALMTRESLRMAEISGKLIDVSQTTGFTVEQFQALELAASQTGVKLDKLAMSTERFTINLEDLRRGQGEMLDGLLAVDPALARQLTQARSTAEAWDLLAKALQRANLEERNRIAQAAFGRGGIALSRTAAFTSERGGLDATLAGMEKLAIISKEQAERWDNLGDTAARSLEIARRIIGQMFAEPVLQAEKNFADNLVTISKTAAEFRPSDKWESFLAGIKDFGNSRFFEWLASRTPGALPILPIPTPMQSPRRTEMEAMERFEQIGMEPQGPQLGQTAQFMLSIHQRRMQVLGEAATAAEKYRLKELEIAAAVEKNTELQKDGQRAMGEFLRARQASTDAARVSLGIATEEQTVRAAVNRTLREARENNLSFADTQRAVAIATREAKEQFEQLEVRLARFKGLKQLELDARNFDKQLDQMIVGSLNSVSQAIASFASGSMSAGDAFRGLTQSVVQGLVQMAVQLAIVAPLAKALQASLGFGNPLFGSSASAQSGSLLGSGTNWFRPTGHTGAVIGSEASATGHFVNPLAFLGAPRMATGGMLGLKPGEVPFIGHQGEVVGWPGKMGGPVPEFNVTIEDHAGGSASVERKRNASGGIDARVIIRNEVQRTLASGKGDAAFGSRYGQRPSIVRR